MGILERRMTELGRIRIGDRVPVGKAEDGKTKPRRLKAFRLTSHNKPRLEHAARLWGGQVAPWEEGPQEKLWQLYTEADTLPVIVPPFNALSQYNEIWQGGECRLRCDGESIIHAAKVDRVGDPCFCERMPLQERLDKAKVGQACHTITRLSLILPDIPGVGIWRFETGSFYAGMELQGGTEMLQQASAEGAFIECALQIEERRVKRRTDGKQQTQVFSVVTLQPQVTMRQLLSRDVAAHAIGSGAPVKMLGTAPAAVEELWGAGGTHTFPAGTQAIATSTTVPATAVELPDDGWRSALRALLPQLSPHRQIEGQEAIDDPQTVPGYGLALLHAAQTEIEVHSQGEREPGEEG